MFRNIVISVFICGHFCAVIECQTRGQDGKLYSKTEGEAPLEKMKRFRKENLSLEDSDLSVSLENCSLVKRFKKSLLEAQKDIFPFLLTSKDEISTTSHKQNLDLVKRARLWAGKLLSQVQTIINSCLPKHSQNFHRILISVDKGREDILSRIYSNRRINRQNRYRKLFFKKNKRRKIGLIANAILELLKTSGKINETSFFTELLSSSHRPGNVPYVSAHIRGHIRDIPPYFLSVAIGAKIIRRGILADLANSARFVTLTRGLSPAILRYGGTFANFLIYEDIVADEVLDFEPQDDIISSGPRLEKDDASPTFIPTEGRYDCPFDEEFHSHYKVKPKSDSSESSYDLLAAIFPQASKKGLVHPKDEPQQVEEDESGQFEDEEVNKDKDYKNYTMTAENLATLMDFAEDVGMLLLFDVNQLYRTPDGKDWNPANARRIFQDVAATKRLVIWQLGNEPNAYNHKFGLRLSGREDASDFGIFKRELEEFFEEPLIVGPDVTRPKIKGNLFDKEMESKLYIPSEEYLQEFLAHLNVNLTAITWHHYYIDGEEATIQDFLSADLFNDLVYSITRIVQTRDQLAPGTPIWLTETSSAYSGGAPNLSNRYADGFPWMDKLGKAASMGIDVVARQTLYKSNYAIIGADIFPEPSYWLSYVFKNLVGESVLDLKMEGASGTTRLYAHCQKNSSAHSYQTGNIVVFGMNLDINPVDVSVSGIHPRHVIEQYLLEPEYGDLQSEVVKLNGKTLQMISDEELPELSSVVLPDQRFQIPPTSYGFWVIVNAAYEYCLQQPPI